MCDLSGRGSAASDLGALPRPQRRGVEGPSAGWRRRRGEGGPRRVKASAGDHSRSAQKRWWWKLLVRLDEGRAYSGRVAGSRGEEARAGRAGVVERKSAADQARQLPGARDDRMRADRMPVRLAPLRLAEAQPAAELGHSRPSGNAIRGLPAVQRLQLLRRGSLEPCSDHRLVSGVAAAEHILQRLDRRRIRGVRQCALTRTQALV